MDEVTYVKICFSEKNGKIIMNHQSSKFKANDLKIVRLNKVEVYIRNQKPHYCTYLIECS